MFCWKLANLLVLLSVVFSLVDNGNALGSWNWKLFFIFGLNIHKLQVLSCNALECVLTVWINTLLGLYERWSSRRKTVVDYPLIENSIWLDHGLLLASNLVVAVDRKKEVIKYLKLKPVLWSLLFLLEAEFKESFVSSVSIDITQFDVFWRLIGNSYVTEFVAYEHRCLSTHTPGAAFREADPKLIDRNLIESILPLFIFFFLTSFLL